MRSRKLKRSLFLIPSIIICIAFAMVIGVFNAASHRYLEKITNKAISDEFAVFDHFYHQQYKDSGYRYEREDEEFIIPTYNVVLDENHEILYPHQPWYSEQEKERTLAIKAHLDKYPLLLRENTAFKVDTPKDTYYTKLKKYEGIYEDYIFIEAPEEESRTYYLVVYTNITALQNFIDLLNEMLILLMLGSGILSLAAFFGMAKKINHSLDRLKSYIIGVGERKELSDLERLSYEEFNDLADTVKKMSQMIERAEESQKQFFQNASHELRTPLMSIQGYAEGISTGVLKDQKKASEIIIRESQKMSLLVSDILLLSRIEKNDFEEHYEEIDMKELLYECTWSVKSIADRRELVFEHDFDEAWMAVYGDEELLKSALGNIISNALRYAEKRILLSCKKEGDRIRIRISDDGPGIAENDLPNIFARFYKGEGGNTGIGLSIAKDIIKKHGGEIEAENANGARFTIWLPEYQRKSK
ncbi:MAG: HAMP domain-containing sensor histidine kinase [Johnsonella sp.]|nr:HAMP domain-containing sensor histidine kinase [Johnsonella sp.]